MNYLEKRERNTKITNYLVNHLTSKGIPSTVDTYGNIKFTVDGSEYRYKIQELVVRYEKKIHLSAGQYSPASTEWLRRASYSIKTILSKAEECKTK